MTKQVPDWVIYQDEQYELLADTSKQLPMLKRFDMQLVSMTTACHRGYNAKYIFADSRLYLTYLAVLDLNHRYPEIGGIKPTVQSSLAVYDSFVEPMPIDGAIVIGKDVPEGWLSLFDHRWTHDYVNVFRVEVKAGVIQSIADLSQESAAIRNDLIKIFDERRELKGMEFVQYKQKEMKQLFDRSFALLFGSSSV